MFVSVLLSVLDIPMILLIYPRKFWKNKINTGPPFVWIYRIPFITCSMVCQNCWVFLQDQRQCVWLTVSVLYFGHCEGKFGLNLCRREGDIWALCNIISWITVTLNAFAPTSPNLVWCVQTMTNINVKLVRTFAKKPT